MDQFAAYGHALLSIAIWIVVVQVLSAVVGAAKAGAGIAPGGTPKEDYADRGYRLHRAYQNAVDNLVVFAVAVVLAILAGASPFWVNLLASVAVVARLVMVFVHIRGIGKPAQGLRTAIFVFHWALILIIVLLGAIAVF